MSQESKLNARPRSSNPAEMQNQNFFFLPKHTIFLIIPGLQSLQLIEFSSVLIL